jgi:WD40 repeat protein
LKHVRSIQNQKGLKGHSSHITAIAISHGNIPKIVSASWDASLRVWDFLSGKHILTYFDHRCPVTCVTISPSDIVFSGDQNHFIHVWDLNVGQTFRILTSHTGPVCSLSISNTSSLCAHPAPSSVSTNWSFSNGSYSNSILASGSENGQILIWNISNYDLVCQLTHPSRGQPVAIVSLCLSKCPSTLLVSGGTCGTIALWKLSTQELLHVFEGHFGPVSGLTIYEDPNWIQTDTSDDCTTRISTDADGGDTIGAVHEPQHPLLVSSSADWTIRIWNLTTKTLIRILEGHSGSVESLALYTPTLRSPFTSSSSFPRTSSGRLVTDSNVGRGARVALEGGGWSFNNHPTNGTVPSSKCQHSPLIISGGRDETIRVWDLMTGALYRNLEDHAEGIGDVTTHSNQDTGEGEEGGEEEEEREEVTTDTSQIRIAGVTSLAVTTTYTRPVIVSGGSDYSLQLWNLDRIICDINWERRKHFGHFIFFIRHCSEDGNGVYFHAQVLPNTSLTQQTPQHTTDESSPHLLHHKAIVYSATSPSVGPSVPRIYQLETSAFLQSCQMDEICYLIAAYL